MCSILCISWYYSTMCIGDSTINVFIVCSDRLHCGISIISILYIDHFHLPFPLVFHHSFQTQLIILLSGWFSLLLFQHMKENRWKLSSYVWFIFLNVISKFSCSFIWHNFTFLYGWTIQYFVYLWSFPYTVNLNTKT